MKREPPPLMGTLARRLHSSVLLASRVRESGEAKHLVNDKTGTRKLPIGQSLRSPTGAFPGCLGHRRSWTVQEDETGNQDRSAWATGQASLRGSSWAYPRAPGQLSAGLEEAAGWDGPKATWAEGARLPASFSIWTKVSSVGAPSRSFSVSRLPHAFRSLRTEPSCLSSGES